MTKKCVEKHKGTSMKSEQREGGERKCDGNEYTEKTKKIVVESEARQRRHGNSHQKEKG